MGLFAGCRVDVNRFDEGFTALRKHQGDEPSSRTDVEDAVAAVDVYPCAEQNAVGPDLHGTFVLPDGELFELKITVRHTLFWI